MFQSHCKVLILCVRYHFSLFNVFSFVVFFYKHSNVRTALRLCPIYTDWRRHDVQDVEGNVWEVLLSISEPNKSYFKTVYNTLFDFLFLTFKTQQAALSRVQIFTVLFTLNINSVFVASENDKWKNHTCVFLVTLRESVLIYDSFHVSVSCCSLIMVVQHCHLVATRFITGTPRLPSLLLYRVILP